MTHQFFELFSRPSSVDQGIADCMERIFKKGEKISHVDYVPEHIIEERYSSCQRRFLVRHKIMAPLANKDGKPAAFLSALEAKILEN